MKAPIGPMNPMDVLREMSGELEALQFGPPVAYVYNPLVYAWGAHLEYLERYGNSRREALLLGMNPGPWGMAQTGVPFGEVVHVRDWLGVEAHIGKPENEHPKRPVTGFDCERSEVSGQRLWGWARDTFKTPKAFFKRLHVVNYCPLMFLEKGGKNRTPDQLPASERAPLIDICDRALRRLCEYYRPRIVIGIGGFAHARAKEALQGLDIEVGTMLHPSPASPAANKGWAKEATRSLRRYQLL